MPEVFGCHPKCVRCAPWGPYNVTTEVDGEGLLLLCLSRRIVALPEGVAPASGYLQNIVSHIFTGFEEWTICIFDNVLLLARSYEDAYRKLDLFLDRCLEFNLYLKFSKSFLGFKEVNFLAMFATLPVIICRKTAFRVSGTWPYRLPARVCNLFLAPPSTLRVSSRTIAHWPLT